MSNIGSQSNKCIKEKVIQKCWDYLNANFDNFKPENKLKILLTICGKSIPQEIKGEGFSNDIKQIIIVKDTKDIGNNCREVSNAIPGK